jgi:methyl-accepting chemotaxis protein
MTFKDALIEARSSEVRHLDEAAWTTVASYYDRAAKGLMTEAAAQEAAKAAIRAMRYDGTNYFFIWDLNGTSIAHGGNQAFEGKNFITGPDAEKSPGVADMVGKLVNVAKEHREGFARYKIPKAGQTIPLDKIGYSKLFAPWGWAIGTGTYIVDIDNEISGIFWRKAWLDLIAMGCITALVALFSFLLAHDLSQSLRSLIGAMKKLAAGNLSSEVPGLDRRDEVGGMAGTVQVFKENAIRMLELEREKAAEQKAAAEAAAFVVGSIGMGLERLAAGDLTYHLGTTLPPAYEKIRLDLNSAMAQLKNLVTGIVANTSAIRSGTGEIAHAADDLSRRIEEQAASLEETAATLSEITATVKRNSDSSGEASSIVKATRENAERTGIMMRDAVGAMGKIRTSSHQIAQIIGVIDEIAYQTNLLSLNAAVEAARAGEAGRGFAVVAAEVRALAQRTAAAAKEIKELIVASTEQVNQGASLVGETGQALDKIVKQIGEVSAAIATIATSSSDQAIGLYHLNDAVNQMDQVTQHNAAMLEQSAAASHALMREAEKLGMLADRFRVAAN